MRYPGLSGLRGDKNVIELLDDEGGVGDAAKMYRPNWRAVKVFENISRDMPVF